jgi:hypothetical protein
MPTIKRFSSCKVCIYAADHLPPHFHILANDGRNALVEISTLTVLAGIVGSAVLSEVTRWAAGKKEFLQSKWDELNHA